MTIKITLPTDKLTFKRWELVNYRREITKENGNQGVYVLRDRRRKVLYVGKSMRLYSRLQSHIRSSPFGHKIAYITLYFVDEPYELDIYETYAINLFKPKYNKDKAYYREIDRRELTARRDELEEFIDELRYQRCELKRELYDLRAYFDADSALTDNYSFYQLGELMYLRERLRELSAEIDKLVAEHEKIDRLLND
jgi:predicted GIY-YIG superfamily endonuclease